MQHNGDSTLSVVLSFNRPSLVPLLDLSLLRRKQQPTQVARMCWCNIKLMTMSFADYLPSKFVQEVVSKTHLIITY